MILGLLFWSSIILSLCCSFKAKKYGNTPWNDILFLFSSWPTFNLGIWHKYLYLYANIPEELAFPLASAILVIISLLFIEKRGIKLHPINSLAKDIFYAAKWLIITATVLISFGFFLGFIQWNPKLDPAFILNEAIDYYFFVATTEELIFRAIVFNLLNKKFKDWAAMILTSLLFALTPSHIAGHGIFPNWPYVGMALVAGLFYVLSYRESKNVFVPIFLHGSTDTLWKILFSP